MSVAMDLALNTQLQNSLRTVEGRLLEASVEGAESLSNFYETWSVLQQRIAAGQKASSLSEETLSFIHTVATNVSVLAQGSPLETIASGCASRLKYTTETVVDNCLQSLTAPSLQSPPTPSRSPSPQSRRKPKPSLQPHRHPTSTPISSALAPIIPAHNPSIATSVTESSRSASDPNPLPEFIEHAYKFLVANLFNPYPSRDDKQAIVDKTNNARVTLTSVSNWFTNARRRCGWTEILKGRCNGSRDVMVDLAKRVFVNPDPRNPVEPAVVAELMEMKEAVESMYERKTRTSAWIEDLDGLDELINPMTEEQRQAAKRREAEEERGARRQEKEMQKEQREFERQKRKMQAEALRKADKVTKKMQREQERAQKKEQRMASLAMPYPCGDDEFVPEPMPVAGGKRTLEDMAFRDMPEFSPAPSSPSIDRVPSLTWSDSGEERPYKRSRSSPLTPPTSSPALSPPLEIPASFHYPFTFEPSTAITADPSAFDSLFDFSVDPSETFMAVPRTPVRGQKRPHDADGAATSRAKRPKPIVTIASPELAPAPSTSLFTPTPSLQGTPTQSTGRRSSLIPIDLETVLGLDQAHPQLVQIAPPDASVPLEVGVFDWASNPALDQFDAAAPLDPQADFSQLFRLFTEGLPEQSGQAPDVRLDVSAFDLTVPDFLPHAHATSSVFPDAGVPDDLSGLMSGLMSDEALNDMGLNYSASVPPTPPDLSRSSSVSRALSPEPHTPSPTSLTPHDSADNGLKKEQKRKELEKKRAALEKKRVALEKALAETQRELEDE